MFDNIFVVSRQCEYKSMKYDALDAGKRIAGTTIELVSDIRACQDKCDETPDCHSIRFCPSKSKCSLMDKVLTGIEEMVDHSVCHSSYQTACDGVGKNGHIMSHVALKFEIKISNES